MQLNINKMYHYANENIIENQPTELITRQEQ